MLKDSLPATLPVITNLINSSFASNFFARAWKSAVVIANLKSGDPDELENTRPISLLPLMSKVLRGLLATRSLWTSWIKIARYLAYRVEIESSTSLKPPYYITRTSSLRIWMKNLYPAVFVLLDMSKAFDSIQHDNLLSKLHLLGVSASALAWLRVTYHYASR